MGWTGTHAKYYKNGNVDRKAEIDHLFTQEEHDGYAELTVLKSAMVGSTYYGAIQEKRGGVIECVFGAIVLTSIDNRDYFNFSYKDMTEEMHPFYYKCPLSILNLLTPTDSENANKWREGCREYHANKKAGKTPASLPVGTKIRFTLWNGTTYEVVKMAPNYQFKRSWWYVPASNTYLPARRIPKNFEIIEEVAI